MRCAEGIRQERIDSSIVIVIHEERRENDRGVPFLYFFYTAVPFPKTVPDRTILLDSALPSFVVVTRPPTHGPSWTRTALAPEPGLCRADLGATLVYGQGERPIDPLDSST